MKILICGASGFVGRHLTNTLRAAGLRVLRGVRHPAETGDIQIGFHADTRADIWLPRLAGIDVVINAVGVLRDCRTQPMQKIHAETPRAIFSAAAQTGVQRVVQISALGVDSGIPVAYFNTKLLAEQALRNLPSSVRTLCFRSSVIYGEDGDSARLFRRLARLPIHAQLMGGRQSLQPVHIDDICAAITRWLTDANAVSQRVNAVGNEATNMRGMLDSYRQQMGLNPAWHVDVPEFLLKPAAFLGDYIPASPLCRDTLAMLGGDNTADVAAFAELLGRAPQSYREFLRGQR
jgi:nucleoside-diphosphate-sugar epimerase